jgi:hypothetical protein
MGASGKIVEGVAAFDNHEQRSKSELKLLHRPNHRAISADVQSAFWKFEIARRSVAASTDAASALDAEFQRGRAPDVSLKHVCRCG